MDIAVTIDTRNTTARTEPTATLRIGQARDAHRDADSLEAARDKLAAMLAGRKERLLAELAHVQYNLDHLQELYQAPPRLHDFLAGQHAELVARLGELIQTPGRFRLGPLQVENTYMNVPGLWVLQLDEYAAVTECFLPDATALVRAAFEQAGLRITSEWNGEHRMTWSIRATPVAADGNLPGPTDTAGPPGTTQPEGRPQDVLAAVDGAPTVSESANDSASASVSEPPLPPPAFPVTMTRLLEVLEWIPGMTTDKPVRSMALAALEYARMLDPLSAISAAAASAKAGPSGPSLAGLRTVKSDSPVSTFAPLARFACTTPATPRIPQAVTWWSLACTETRKESSCGACGVTTITWNPGHSPRPRTAKPTPRC
jgi:hypothetical protein